MYGENSACNHCGTILSQDGCLAEIMDDPIVDQYRLSAELQLFADASHHAGSGNMSRMGIYFNHQSAPISETESIHAFYTLEVNPYDINLNPGEVIQLPKSLKCGITSRVFWVRNNSVYHTSTNTFDHFPLVLENQMPSRWQKLAVECTPTECKVWVNRDPDVDQPSGIYTTEDFQQNSLLNNLAITKYMKTEVLTERWNPRHGLGLFILSAHANIKNVTLQSQPGSHSVQP
jgi:hypothetical protein